MGFGVCLQWMFDISPDPCRGDQIWAWRGTKRPGAKIGNFLMQLSGIRSATLGIFILV